MVVLAITVWIPEVLFSIRILKEVTKIERKNGFICHSLRNRELCEVDDRLTRMLG